jgi:hypothetical protein
MSSFYDGVNGHRTYRFPAATLSAAATVGRIQGPAGKVGRVTGVEYLLTTATTVAATALTLDTVAGLTAPLSVSIPVLAINLGGAASAAELKAGAELPADTVVNVASDGGCTAGAGDLNITIQWY